LWVGWTTWAIGCRHAAVETSILGTAQEPIRLD
jgi:hypothetical protein